MIKHNVVVFLLSCVLISCAPAMRESEFAYTAQSIQDIRWESAPEFTPDITPPHLDCDAVNECTTKGLVPNRHTIGDSELYVWTYTYWNLETRQTALYAVINRPIAGTWDMLGLEYIKDIWQVGVYGELMPIYDGSSYSFIPGFAYIYIGDAVEFPVAMGMRSELWAIIVTPVDTQTFTYTVEETYWK